MVKTAKKTRRGGGYGFGGSLLNPSASNAGNQNWVSDTGTNCGNDANRGGNGTFAGGTRGKRGTRGTRGRRYRKKTRGGSSCGNGGRRRRGGARGGNGNPDLAVQIPRSNNSFRGNGVAGIANFEPDTY